MHFKRLLLKKGVKGLVSKAATVGRHFISKAVATFIVADDRFKHGVVISCEQVCATKCM
jgi:hypothetical protein